MLNSGWTKSEGKAVEGAAESSEAKVVRGAAKSSEAKMVKGSSKLIKLDAKKKKFLCRHDLSSKPINYFEYKYHLYSMLSERL